MLLAGQGQIGGYCRWKDRASLFVGYNLKSAQQAASADFTYQFMATEFGHFLLEVFAHPGGLRKNIIALIDFQALQRNSAAQGMATIGITMTEYADPGRGLYHRLIHITANNRRADGHIRR